MKNSTRVKKGPFVIGIAPCYNESSKGHLDRFMNNIKYVVDGLVVLDDASTDDSCKRLERSQGQYLDVIWNRTNNFLCEQENTQKLIDRALVKFPWLTHILTLNIDSTFPESCFRDGDAKIHKIVENHPRIMMWTARNVHLWRSQNWYRSDGEWEKAIAERIYVRKYNLRMASLKPGLHQGKVTATPHRRWKSLTHYDPNVLSIHWGFSTKELIVDKFHYYMSKEPKEIPNPEMYQHENVFKLLDEWNLETKPVNPDWFSPDVVRNLADVGTQPKPISYAKEIMRYDVKQAEKYQRYYNRKFGLYPQ